ncbi:carbohydrate binding domain-containing protein [Antarcticibacterium sp. 1MA-6-2]|uniref:carbohydrate binding domain-containing protein n=1 Tax=Antarcticibacterium sp. 1MA-6-2 TaxID=2908210 RepID=UPI001F34988B|nr:carbohydrate binding domain-containing protein [Antarcticibacterium sp. 1MA-6-2]UJH90601.1 carbohydrate binding domain-containing protein [Antarcticibacterium sp. 1MA-6-2]
MKVTQTAGVEGWAGFFFDLSGKVDFSEKQTIKIKVYSPAAGQNVNLKLEDSSDGSVSKEVTMTTTKAEEWEEISFAFSPSDTDKFDRMVLFFNFNGDKGGTTVHYFDDIILAEGGATEEPGDDSEPTEPSPDPTVAEDKVISLFSDVYTNVTVDTWRTEWSNASLEEITIDGNNVKKYSDLNFVGIETVASQIDVTAMTHLHVDIWTANATEFKIKLVDFGADAAFEGGDDVEHEIVIANPTQKEWFAIDIPLADFTGLTTKENIAQLLFVASPSGENTTYVDNVYFYNSSGISTEPVSAAPAPTRAESDVISLFSDAYTDVTVDTWRTGWSSATLEDISINGNAVKKYSGLNFVGVETVGTQINASEMEYFHTDVWTADATEIRIKLVDFGADGAFEGGDDVEHEITIANPQRNSWVSLDLALSDFTLLNQQGKYCTNNLRGTTCR